MCDYILYTHDEWGTTLTLAQTAIDIEYICREKWFLVRCKPAERTQTTEHFGSRKISQPKMCIFCFCFDWAAVWCVSASAAQAHWDSGVVHKQARGNNSQTESRAREQRIAFTKQKTKREKNWMRKVFVFRECDMTWHRDMVVNFLQIAPTYSPIEYNYASDESDIGILGAISRPCSNEADARARARALLTLLFNGSDLISFFIFCSASVLRTQYVHTSIEWGNRFGLTVVRLLSVYAHTHTHARALRPRPINQPFSAT